MDFKIYRGLSSALFDIDGNLILPTDKREDGAWYITTDKFEVYIYLDGQMHPLTAHSWDEDRVVAIEETVEQLSEKVLGEHTYTHECFGYYNQMIQISGKSNVIYTATDKNCDYVWNTETQSYEVYRDYNQLNDIDMIHGGDSTSK